MLSGAEYFQSNGPLINVAVTEEAVWPITAMLLLNLKHSKHYTCICAKAAAMEASEPTGSAEIEVDSTRSKKLLDQSRLKTREHLGATLEERKMAKA